MSNLSGYIVTLTGQSGSGKTTISKFLQEKYPEFFTEVVSHTTRGMREGEREGYQYYFISEAEFDRMNAAGEFLEMVDFCGRKYGSAYAEADMRTGTGLNAFVILEPHGVEQWQKNYDSPMLHILVQAPSEDEIVTRMKLQGRSEEEIRQRLAHDESVFNVDPACYHLVVENDQLEQACKTIYDFVLARSSSP